jgi:4-hydroxy-2-oxoheptanedioate aldolase
MEVTMNGQSGAEHLRRRLALREQTIGTLVKLPSIDVVDIMAGAGFDFIMVDLEHSPLGENDAFHLVHYAHARGLPAVVRIPDCDPAQVNRLLEAGASGIQLSMVRSVADVRRLVDATRYPPAGKRSVSLTHPAASYGRVPLRQAIAGDYPFLVGQIETGETADPLDAIASAGLDVLFVGVIDLTVDLGFDDARVATHIDAVRRAAGAAGVAFGIYAPNAAAMRDDAEYVVLSSDFSFLIEGADRALEAARLFSRS